jgi:hypothetical protein
LVEADEDTGDEAEGGDAGVAPDTGGAAKVRRKTTRSTVEKQSASAAAAAAAVAAVKAADKKKKKRKRRAASPPVVVTPSIPTPRSREVESEGGEEESEKEKDETIAELRSMSNRRGGRRVMLPRGSGSWCRRRRRMPSDVDWRCSVVLQWRRRGCLQLLSLRCFGQRLGFRR